MWLLTWLAWLAWLLYCRNEQLLMHVVGCFLLGSSKQMIRRKCWALSTRKLKKFIAAALGTMKQTSGACSNTPVHVFLYFGACSKWLRWKKLTVVNISSCLFCKKTIRMTVHSFLCWMCWDSVGICLHSTLQMLTNIENRLEELFQQIELLPPDKVEAAEKVKLY